MAINNRQGKTSADAFDDLLGQLVDELAMTPTKQPPKPEPEKLNPAADQQVATVSSGVDESQVQRPKSSAGMLIGGGLVIAGLAVAATYFYLQSQQTTPQPNQAPKNQVAVASQSSQTPPVIDTKTMAPTSGVAVPAGAATDTDTDTDTDSAANSTTDSLEKAAHEETDGAATEGEESEGAETDTDAEDTEDTAEDTKSEAKKTTKKTKKAKKKPKKPPKSKPSTPSQPAKSNPGTPKKSSSVDPFG